MTDVVVEDSERRPLGSPAILRSIWLPLYKHGLVGRCSGRVISEHQGLLNYGVRTEQRMDDQFLDLTHRGDRCKLEKDVSEFSKRAIEQVMNMQSPVEGEDG